ncbi:uncharacterized protein LOC135834480 [Planococcus citri]|uniref:uncharacterized protein LOC135834480 n=1 Tax=Planococcus citri TaxID=170843 RepID=UPI0031F80DD2
MRTRSDKNGADAEGGGSPEMTPEVQLLIQQQVQMQVQAILAASNNSLFSDQQQLMAADRAYITPTFQLRSMGDHEKLNGHRNFRAWRNMVELDLRALNLYPFITSPRGSEVEISQAKRNVLDAQTMQYITMAVSRPIAARLHDLNTAYDMYGYISQNYGSGRIQDMVDLHNRFVRLRFRRNFDPDRFIADFEQMINEYQNLGTVFSDEYITTIFLQKIEGIYDHRSPYSTFFSTITTLPDENHTLEFIKERFLRIAENDKNKKFSDKKPFDSKKPENDKRNESSSSASSASGKNQRKRPIDSTEKSDEPKVKISKPKYTPQQVEQLKTMSKEEKLKILCTKCGEYFHKEKDCPNPGKACYGCREYGHVRADCPKGRK